jgi:5-formyltetrahydrofolate cyclo-ligase
MEEPNQRMQARKQQLRSELQVAIRAITPDVAADFSDRICRHIQEWEPYARARTLMLYAPTPPEPDVFDLVSAAIAAGKRLCAPRTDWQRQRLTPAMVNDWSNDMVAGRYGINEPRESCALVPLADIDLVIVPGVAFDPTGCRLGRGGGFYDRLLADPALRATTCGVCFAEALLPDLPCQPHDARVQAVCTERGLTAAAAPPAA